MRIIFGFWKASGETGEYSVCLWGMGLMGHMGLMSLEL